MSFIINFETLIDNISSLLSRDIQITFGVELEFYVSNLITNEEINQLQLNDFIKSLDTAVNKYANILEETGLNQFEVNYKEFFTHPKDLISFIFEVKEQIKKSANKSDLEVIFDTKPYHDQPASSMHIHLGMRDVNTLKNLFTSSEILHYSIGGLLAYLLQSMYIFCPSDNCYQRFQKPELSNPNIYYPTNCSWGIDNRTCAIRTTSLSSNNIHIEHRVPSMISDPYKVINAMLYAIQQGLKNKIIPSEPIYGNAFSDENENIYPQLPTSLKQAYEYFKVGEIKDVLLEDS